MEIARLPGTTQISSSEITNVELARRLLETRNERIINGLRVGMFGLAFLVHLSNWISPWVHFKTPGEVPLVLGIALFLCLGIEVHLNSNPPYHPCRKYALAPLEVVIVTANIDSLDSQALGPAAILVPQLLYLIAIILAGLRFSSPVVWMVGGFSMAVGLHRIQGVVPSGERGVAILICVAVTSVATIAVAFLVKTVLELHRESVLKTMLQRFLAPELVAEVSRDPKLMQGEVKQMTATVLFTDIRGFTQLSEKLTPKQVVTFLNRFLDEMTRSVMVHEGMLDKYIGDAVMAVFGVPIKRDDHADRALRAALDMKQRLEELNRELEESGLPTLGIGIGMHSGPLVVGAIGSQQRQDYTVIGDTVNVASRIESLTRKLDTDILLSESTVSLLSEHFSLTEIGTEVVKGRDAAVKVYGVK